MARKYRPILITGHPFSGMDRVVRSLQGVGVDFGYGPLNMYGTARRVSERVIKPHLRALGCDPLGQDPMPEKQAVDKTWGRRVRKALGGPRKPWGYSDAKIAPTAVQWQHAFPDAAWIVCWQEPEILAERYLDHPLMRARQTKSEWVHWLEYVNQTHLAPLVHGNGALTVHGEIDVGELIAHCGLARRD